MTYERQKKWVDNNRKKRNEIMRLLMAKRRKVPELYAKMLEASRRWYRNKKAPK